MTKYIITCLDIEEQKVKLLGIKYDKYQALSFLMEQLDKSNQHKLIDNIIDEYKINQGHLYNNKTLSKRYQIIEYENDKKNSNDNQDIPSYLDDDILE
jgi:hypothetical protein